MHFGAVRQYCTWRGYSLSSYARCVVPTCRDGLCRETESQRTSQPNAAVRKTLFGGGWRRSTRYGRVTDLRERGWASRRTSRGHLYATRAVAAAHGLHHPSCQPGRPPRSAPIPCRLHAAYPPIHPAHRSPHRRPTAQSTHDPGRINCRASPIFVGNGAFPCPLPRLMTATVRGLAMGIAAGMHAVAHLAGHDSVTLAATYKGLTSNPDSSRQRS